MGHDETLMRIEDKLDRIIEALQGMGLMPMSLPPMEMRNTCPVCKTYLSHSIDPASGSVSRVCACRSGVSGGGGINKMAPQAPGGSHGSGHENQGVGGSTLPDGSGGA